MAGLSKCALLVVAAAAVPAGCATKAPNGPQPAAATSTSLLGGLSHKSSSSVYIASLQGGIVKRTNVQLSSGDRERALEAEYRALEASPGGQPVTWQGADGVGGEVVANAPYQVGAQNCRQYSHKLTANGKTVEARGAACRNDKGTWTPLT
ncbi:surface antigen [Rhizobium halophytocola]|uniref:Surface antigen n=1 Tax=Rhizobium halophytocola TaxID=735519 RepID=A0ABS4DYW6_9HYPH|nr:surface antigen [Rhizobium halophytocola]